MRGNRFNSVVGAPQIQVLLGKRQGLSLDGMIDINLPALPFYLFAAFVLWVASVAHAGENRSAG